VTVTPHQLLQRAITMAGPRCRFCQCARVTVEDRPGLGPVPVSYHYVRRGRRQLIRPATWLRRPGDRACPALSGGYRARLVHEDLWLELDNWLPPADYGSDTRFAAVRGSRAT
jgi:hypothetical protein